MDGVNKVTIWSVVIMVIVVIIGVTAAAAFSKGKTSGQQAAAITSAVMETDWIKGNKDASVSLIEYGDFQCPACAAYYPMVEELMKEYGDRIKFVYRHFPLYLSHPNADITARAAEAAGLQNKFWEMYDLLYKKKNDWANADPKDIVEKYLNGYAESIGLDLKKFAADLDGDQVKTEIEADVKSGRDANLNHTPTFFVNLKEIPNPKSYAELKSIIDQALKNS